MVRIFRTHFVAEGGVFWGLGKEKVKMGHLSPSILGPNTSLPVRDGPAHQGSGAPAVGWRAVTATAAERRAAIAKKAARILSVEEVEPADTPRQVRHLHCARAHSGPKLDCEMRALTDWFVCRLAPQIEKQGGLPPAEQVVKLSGRIVGDGGFVVWHGRLRRGTERALEGTWVRSNFKASFLDTVLAALGAFVYIPTGHAQDRPPLSASMGGHLVWDGPKVLAATATPVKSVAACPMIAHRQAGADLCAAYM